jgi:quercetin dioxygenase-like cupin family protein
MSPERHEIKTTRLLDAPLSTFDVSTLLKEIKSEQTWQKGTRNAKTLLKGQRLRVVLVAMHAGTLMESHRADAPISLQVIEGRLKFSTDSEFLVLRKGQVLTLQAGIRHKIEALKESAFLLTLATSQSHPAEL